MPSSAGARLTIFPVLDPFVRREDVGFSDHAEFGSPATMFTTVAGFGLLFWLV